MDIGLLICGVTADSALGVALGAAFGASAGLVRDVLAAGMLRPQDLAIGVHGDADRDAADRFDAWARTAGACALSVRPGASEIVIGPLAVPARAGCGHCARVRMAAAEAAASGGPRAQAADAGREVSADLAALLVREIAAIRDRPVESRLIDHVLVCDAGSTQTSLHRVIPLSRCPVCGGAAAWPVTPPRRIALGVDDDPESVLAALAGWVDPRTGVISQIALELSGEAGDEPPIVATASPPHAPGPGGTLRRLPIGWGKGMTLSSALLSAIGEAIERYAASLPDPDRIVRARRDALHGSVLDPRDCALYAEAQYDRDGFAFRRFDPDLPHPWVLGTWLDSGEPVWVPAVFAFLALDLAPDQQIWQGTSNGLAASTDADDAALRATLELVERDAFLAAWLTGRRGWRLDLARSLDPALARVVAGVEALGAEVEILVLPTSACGTTALCLAFGDGDRYPGVTLGLGCDLEPRAAVRQAILELAQTGPHLRRLMRAGTPQIPAGPEAVRDMIQHAAYYFPVERAAAFERLRGDAAPAALGDLAPSPAPRSLSSCVTALAAAGIRVAVVDVTSPDVATGPFRVVRAVSPQLQPISFGYGLDHPAVTRIRALGLDPQRPPIHPLW